MACGMRGFMFLLLISLQVGCQRREPIPVLKPIASINARVNAVPEWSLAPIESVVVPKDEVLKFAKLITPTRRCLQRIDRDVSYHVADIVVENTDGTETKLMVFSTGHNPAALSFDNKSFYYGGVDDFPDGATRIIRLLRDYDYEQSKGKSMTSEKRKASGTD